MPIFGGSQSQQGLQAQQQATSNAQTLAAYNQAQQVYQAGQAYNGAQIGAVSVATNATAAFTNCYIGAVPTAATNSGVYIHGNTTGFGGISSQTIQSNPYDPINALTLSELKTPIEGRSRGQMKVLQRLTHRCMPRLVVPVDITDPISPSAIRTVHGFKLDEAGAYVLPDGSCLELDHQGNYVVNDTDGKTTYKASRLRDFNPFLNASDLLEEYIGELKPLGVRQDEVLQLAIEHFINWLIHKAAEKDGDPVPVDVPKLPPVALLTKQEAA